MFYCPPKYLTEYKNLNEELMKIKGEMSDVDAKISLAQFLRHNLSFTTQLLTGVELARFQELTLKAFFNRNFNLCVWGRSVSKSFVAMIFVFLQCIFEPGTKVLIAGPTFRTARNMFTELERLTDNPKGKLLLECFGVMSKRSDMFEWRINGGIIRAIPLNGEKIRGFRANTLILDEFLLISEDIIKNVLMPMLAAPANIAERIQVRAIENQLINEGKMKEEERRKFVNTSKLIGLSSASYTFENLYKTYTDWVSRIMMTPEQEADLEKGKEDKDVSSKPTYFVSQMSYESIPPYMIDNTIVQEAASGGSTNAGFLREYCAQFTDGSDSYFSGRKMIECTVPDDQKPTTRLIGESGKKYILAIDPSFSNAPTSDYFAMAVLELTENKQPILINQYAVAGGELKNHYRYLYYLLTNFNIELIVIDNAGAEFIQGANECELFREDEIELKFFEVDTALEGQEYTQMLNTARNNYNKEDNKIVFKQIFSSDGFIRRSNEYLQKCIDYKHIWFASKINAHEEEFDKVIAIEGKIKLDLTPFPSLNDFIDFQDDWIHQVKKQCALIEVKTTPLGTQSFDLPQHLKRSKSANKARKDNYTALLLGVWAAKLYYDLMTTDITPVSNSFRPIAVKKRW